MSNDSIPEMPNANVNTIVLLCTRSFAFAQIPKVCRPTLPQFPCSHGQREFTDFCPVLFDQLYLDFESPFPFSFPVQVQVVRYLHRSCTAASAFAQLSHDVTTTAAALVSNHATGIEYYRVPFGHESQGSPPFLVRRFKLHLPLFENADANASASANANANTNANANANANADADEEILDVLEQNAAENIPRNVRHAMHTILALPTTWPLFRSHGCVKLPKFALQ